MFDFGVGETCVSLLPCVPLFAKLCFANSPLVALSNDMGISLVATSDQGYAPWRAVAF